MLRSTLSALLICSCAGTASGVTPIPPEADGAGAARRWSCHTAEGAQPRKREVERNVLPRVVFTGETAPAQIASRMTRHHTPALSVAVIRAGQLDWTAAWGELAVDGAKAGCDSLFQAGSIAKPATVLAALRMQHAGRIDFDASIDTYLTSWQLPAGKQSAGQPVTLRNLFTHTAGITPGGYMGYAQGQPLPSDQQTVAAEPPSNARKVEVLQAPGTSLAYSGGGYTLAEIALQDRLEQPFERLMRTWLIDPVGMKQADFTQPLPEASHAHTASGHDRAGQRVPGGWHNHPEQAAAGLWATASDLAVLLIELRKGRQGRSDVFSQASIRELLAAPIEGHSFGFRRIGEGEDVFITHYGGTVGYRAGMTINLETGNGAVYLTNADQGSDLGVEFLAAVARVYDWPQFRSEEVERAVLAPEALRLLAGRYAFESGPTVSVVYEQEVLQIEFPNGDRYAMTPIRGAAGEFIHPDSAVRARFEGEGDAASIHLYGETGRRVAAAPADGPKPH